MIKFNVGDLVDISSKMEEMRKMEREIQEMVDNVNKNAVSKNDDQDDDNSKCNCKNCKSCNNCKDEDEDECETCEFKDECCCDDYVNCEDCDIPQQKYKLTDNDEVKRLLKDCRKEMITKDEKWVEKHLSELHRQEIALNKNLSIPFLVDNLYEIHFDNLDPQSFNWQSEEDTKEHGIYDPSIECTVNHTIDNLIKTIMCHIDRDFGYAVAITNYVKRNGENAGLYGMFKIELDKEEMELTDFRGHSVIIKYDNIENWRYGSYDEIMEIYTKDGKEFCFRIFSDDHFQFDGAA